MRPFGPLAGLCLLLSIILQLALVVHPCKEIKLKFDLQRMVESESLFFRLKVGFHPILVFSGTAKKICAGTPRITRGMGTNITLEPGERVRKLQLKILDDQICIYLGRKGSVGIWRQGKSCCPFSWLPSRVSLYTQNRI